MSYIINNYLNLKASYTYLGCFKDCGRVTPCVRDLNALYNYSSTSMTIELCDSFCKGYLYFGLELAYI